MARTTRDMEPKPPANPFLGVKPSSSSSTCNRQAEMRPSVREQARARVSLPKIYYFHPRLAGLLPDWRPHLERIAGLGFTQVNIAPPFLPGANGNVLLADDFEKAHPLFEETGSADELTAKISAACGEFGLALLIDTVLDRVARGGVMAR